jgi:hypothetical protein
LVLIVELTLEESCARQQAGYGERRGIVLHIAEVWQDSLRVFLAGLMVPVRHERWPESALLRPSPWARRGGTVCPSCWYQGDAVPRRGTAGGAERLCTHALVAEQVPCQRVRGIRACGTPLAHHESTEARRGDEAHHAKSALPICGHLQQGGCQAGSATQVMLDGECYFRNALNTKTIFAESSCNSITCVALPRWVGCIITTSGGRRDRMRAHRPVSRGDEFSGPTAGRDWR